jgi:septum formation initiator
MMMGVVVAIAVSYVGPVRGYMAQREALHGQEAQLRALEARRDRLAAEVRALATLPVLEQRARKLGMVRPGEHAFIIQGLEPRPGPGRRAREGSSFPVTPGERS